MPIMRKMNLINVHLRTYLKNDIKLMSESKLKTFLTIYSLYETLASTLNAFF